MPDDLKRPQPLDYHVPSSAQQRPRTLALILILAAAALLLALGGWFFSVSGPSTPLVRTSGSIVNVIPASPTVGPAPVPGFAASLQDPADPELRDAQAAATKALDALLTGALAPDDALAPVARKVAGYQTWSITTRTPATGPPPAWDFSGTLTAPAGRSARFTVRMVKQQAGHWAVGSFRGPDPQ
jgi:hypothetical protein